MTKEIQETIEGLKIIRKEKICFGWNEYSEDDLLNFQSQAIQWGEALEQVEGKLKEKEVYVTDSSKEMAVMSERAIGYNQAISRAQLILAKAILENKEKDKRIEELEKEIKR